MMNEWILSSSLLIAAVLAVRFLLRGRISLRLQYALWAVVLVRLLLPVQLFTSSFGAGSIAKEVDIAEPVRQVYASANEERYEQEYDEAYRRVVADYEAMQQRFDQSYDPVVVEKTAQDMVRADLELDLKAMLYQVWFAGMAVMAAVICACNLHLSLRLKRRRYEYPAADSLLSVYVTEAVPTPCIFGLFRPAVYLTPDAVKDEQVRAHVLAHELTHYRHGDHIWSVLRSVCLVLHWYNPLVWAAAKVSRADAELACDEGALARLGEDHRGDYGRTLIGLTCSAPISDFLLTATTMTGSAGSIRERIRLLMKRPRTTVLTLTAAVLMVTLIVGCSFAGAPDTTQPGIDLEGVKEEIENGDVIFDFPEIPEPTGHAPDNDMAYTGQELPIPDALTASDLQNADGLLVFPGTRWGMTEAELIDALNIQEYGVFSGMRGISLSNTTFCGYPARIAFYFDQYRNTDEWGLSDVLVGFEDEDTANAVYNILYEQLGASDSQTSGFASCVWWSDSTLADLISPEAYAIYQDEHTYYIYDGQSEDLVAASSVTWFGDNVQVQKNRVCFSSRLHLARQIEASLDTSQTSALYALPMEQAMAEYADRNPRELTEEELKEFRAAFTTLDENGNVNPAACFLLPYYEDITEMDGGEFLAYFPTDQEGTEEEFELLKAKYPDYFADWTWETMPFPIHRHNAAAIDRVVSRYANIHWPELDEGVHYLEETGCYYNYTSDFGLGGFYARDGFVYDGGAVIYSGFSALFLTETMGSYTIQSHLPAIVSEG
ncbi:MAG: M56 family metallopeptidase [Oscillospiraceae bacterium]|nr:M56 family metallopeptidase [Oscillospiraceae bacterium]